MAMHTPPHPGLALRRDCIEAVELTVSAAADWLGVSRPALSNVLNGHAAISPDMAIRLEKAGWGTAEAWIKLQYQYDLWEARQHASSIKVKRYKAA